MNLGKQIKLLRGKNSQQWLANNLSISINTLSAYENNRSLPSLEIFKNICILFNASADQLLEIKDISNTPKNQGNMLNDKLYNVRETLNLQQDEIATLINISISTWSKYESGFRVPPLQRFRDICNHCKVSADYLLGLQKN